MDYTTNYDTYMEANDDGHDMTIQDIKNIDPGYNIIYKTNPKNPKKKSKMEFYTCGIGKSYIRNAETGIRYPYKIGSKDEYLFFKASLVDGSCTSKNEGVTLFYDGPHQYMAHQKCELDQSIIENWEFTRNARLRENKQFVRQQYSGTVVR